MSVKSLRKRRFLHLGSSGETRPGSSPGSRTRPLNGPQGHSKARKTRHFRASRPSSPPSRRSPNRPPRTLSDYRWLLPPRGTALGFFVAIRPAWPPSCAALFENRDAPPEGLGRPFFCSRLGLRAVSLVSAHSTTPFSTSAGPRQRGQAAANVRWPHLHASPLARAPRVNAPHPAQYLVRVERVIEHGRGIVGIGRVSPRLEPCGRGVLVVQHALRRRD